MSHSKRVLFTSLPSTFYQTLICRWRDSSRYDPGIWSPSGGSVEQSGPGCHQNHEHSQRLQTLCDAHRLCALPLQRLAARRHRLRFQVFWLFMIFFFFFKVKKPVSKDALVWRWMIFLSSCSETKPCANVSSFVCFVLCHPGILCVWLCPT